MYGSLSTVSFGMMPMQPQAFPVGSAAPSRKPRVSQ
jgi:hypothetical protein